MLQSTFIDELFKGCTLNEEVFKSTSIYLKDKDISKDSLLHKKVLNAIKKLYTKDPETLPSLGVIEQIALSVGGKSLSIEKIEQARKVNPKTLLKELQNYLLKVRVEQSLYSFEDSFNKGNYNGSIISLRDDLINAVDFDIVGDEYESTNPFIDFVEILDSIEDDYDNLRVPFSIPPLDELTKGGMEVTSTALFMLRSGVGKSTILKFIGYMASRMGFRVIHFQLEGSKTEAQTKYNQLWTGMRYNQLNRGWFGRLKKPKVVWDSEQGRITFTDKLEYLKFVNAKMDYLRKRMGKFIMEIIAFEEFGSPDMKMVNDGVEKFAEEFGSPHLIIIDSLDLVYPGDGGRYGSDVQGVKMRIQNSAKMMKNIALKHKSRVVSAIQTGDIKMEDWNNEDFVIDRSRSMGDRNVANPFSFVFSGNRTIKEKRLNEIRLFVDKLRDHEGEGMVFKVPTSFNYGKAVNLRKLKVLKDEEKFDEVTDVADKSDKQINN